eukprot:1157218-Pelagomonas_calceolata.AAC.8
MPRDKLQALMHHTWSWRVLTGPGCVSAHAACLENCTGQTRGLNSMSVYCMLGLPSLLGMRTCLPAGFVFANELSFGPDGVSTGGIVGAVQSARDKGMLLRGLLQHYEGQGHTGAGSLVYIGDSVPDLQPLLAVRV